MLSVHQMEFYSSEPAVASHENWLPSGNDPLEYASQHRGKIPSLLVRQHIRKALDTELERQRTRDRVRCILENPQIQIVYQPAIRLGERRVEFYEALARFSSTSCEASDNWFSAAAEVGLGTELELIAVEWAIRGLQRLPQGSPVSINVSPPTIVSPGFAELLAPACAERIIVEITEQQAVTSYEPMLEALAPLRERGVRIAVDDAGAGYSSLRHILNIGPDIIKMDMSLCRGIHEDHARRALASALISFCKQIGSELVAEGIETADELECLRDLGVQIVQGYIAARPMTVEHIRFYDAAETGIQVGRIGAQCAAAPAPREFHAIA